MPLVPDSLSFRADGRIVRLLKIASTATEGGDNGCRNTGFEHRLGHPKAWADVHEIDGCRGLIAVEEVRAVDAAQPVETVGVAGPDERAIVDFSESGDPTEEAVLLTTIPDALAKAAQSEPTGAVDRRAQIDTVAARPHGAR
jgi:hypothetical protein